MDGRKAIFDDDGIRIQDGKGNEVKIESASGALTIKANGALSIKAASIKLESSTTLEVTANATLTVRGSLVAIN